MTGRFHLESISEKIRVQPGSCVAAWVGKLGGIKAFPASQGGAATGIRQKKNWMRGLNEFSWQLL